MLFSEEELESQRAELDTARQTRNHRAAFGAIMRRHIDTLAEANTEQRVEWLQSIRVSVSYATEISKEVSVYIYELNRALC